MLNQGGSAATNVEATVSWSPVASLVTPDLWTRVGSTIVQNVLVGEQLTVSDAIVWDQAEIPGPGHYCLVGLIANGIDPAPGPMEAVQDSVIYVWDGEDVLRILFGNPDAIRALLRRETQMIRKRRDTIAELAFQPVTGRLAKLLLESIPASETSTDRDLTLDQIAAMVASSPEVFCRTPYQFQRGGCSGLHVRVLICTIASG